ncbi:hypothetical protein GGR00_000232 [Aminobacter aganoensis]|uniref:Uncharacterized protein n=1 Tax=Aminobacter aganoensis TaxID=83264 RepID=A0A7X0F3N6_9HYPH|nr:hypothetical protein [Aminobacter aganoensis]
MAARATSTTKFRSDPCVKRVMDFALLERADVHAAYADNKVGVILGTQNSLMVEGDVALLGAAS